MAGKAPTFCWCPSGDEILSEARYQRDGIQEASDIAITSLRNPLSKSRNPPFLKAFLVGMLREFDSFHLALAHDIAEARGLAGEVSVLDVRRRLCCQLSQRYRAVIHKHTADAMLEEEGMGEEGSEQLDNMVTLEIILQLAELFVLQTEETRQNTHNTLTLSLLQWFQANAMDSEAKGPQEVARLFVSDAPEDCREFWICLSRAVAQGRLRDAEEILWSVSQITQLLDVFGEIQRLLESMPVLTEQPESSLSLQESTSQWRLQCRALYLNFSDQLHRLGSEGGSGTSELSSALTGSLDLLSLLMGEKDAFKICVQEEICPGWQQLLVARVLLSCNPCIPASRIATVARECLVERSEAGPNILDELQLAIMSNELVKALEISVALFHHDEWLLAHLSDLFLQADPPLHSRQVDQWTLYEQRDGHVARYGAALAARDVGHTNAQDSAVLWGLALRYLSTCSHTSHQPHTRALMTEILLRQPVSTRARVLKIRQLCSKYDLGHLVPFVSQAAALQRSLTHDPAGLIQFFYTAAECSASAPSLRLTKALIDASTHCIFAIDQEYGLPRERWAESPGVVGLLLELVEQTVPDWAEAIPSFSVTCHYLRLRLRMQAIRGDTSRIEQFVYEDAAQLVLALFARQLDWPVDIRPQLILDTTLLCQERPGVFQHRQSLDLLLYAEPLMSRVPWKRDVHVTTLSDTNLSQFRTAIHQNIAQTTVELTVE